MSQLQLPSLEEGINGVKVLNWNPCNKKKKGDSWGKAVIHLTSWTLSSFFFMAFVTGDITEEAAQACGCFIGIWQPCWDGSVKSANGSGDMLRDPPGLKSPLRSSFYARSLKQSAMITWIELQTISYLIAWTTNSPVAALQGIIRNQNEEMRSRDSQAAKCLGILNYLECVVVALGN